MGFKCVLVCGNENVTVRIQYTYCACLSLLRTFFFLTPCLPESDSNNNFVYKRQEVKKYAHGITGMTGSLNLL